VIDSSYLLPCVVLVVFVIALIKRVPAYSVFMTGVKDGIGLFLDIYPALLAMMCAIALLRESGLMDEISALFQSVSANIPSQIWPMVLFRPISGSASLAILIDIFKTCGVDSLAGQMASIIQGSTDTTVYVITLYFSSVGIKKIKNSLAIGLIADIAGISLAIVLTMLFFA